MPKSSRRDAAARAEARRRARYQARGVPEEETAEEGQEPSPDREGRSATRAEGGFLTRLFPPAPPLPGKPDPLRGFTYAGPLPGVIGGLYLLARNPLTWIVAGALWALGRLFTDSAAGSLISIVASLISFGALIAAGWFGWQRPWLFGLAAGVLGWLLFVAAILALGASDGAPSVVPPQASASAVASPGASASPDATPTSEPSPAASQAASPGASPGAGTGDDRELTAAVLVQAIAIQTVFQMLLGAAAGWYGGYLRRRMASAPSSRPPQRRR